VLFAYLLAQFLHMLSKQNHHHRYLQKRLATLVQKNSKVSFDYLKSKLVPISLRWHAAWS
jgi:uncharacterized membrane protein required for colicin V production